MKGLKFAPEHILMYTMAGDFKNKYVNYADPTITLKNIHSRVGLQWFIANPNSITDETWLWNYIGFRPRFGPGIILDLLKIQVIQSSSESS
jgi:hypothetical protein